MHNFINEIRTLVNVQVEANYCLYTDEIIIKFTSDYITLRVILISNITSKIMNGYTAKMLSFEAVQRYERKIKKEYFTQKYLKNSIDKQH